MGHSLAVALRRQRRRPKEKLRWCDLASCYGYPAIWVTILRVSMVMGYWVSREPSSWVAGTIQAFEMRNTVRSEQKGAAQEQAKLAVLGQIKRLGAKLRFPGRKQFCLGLARAGEAGPGGRTPKTLSLLR